MGQNRTQHQSQYHLQKHQRICRLTRTAFLINALVLIALMQVIVHTMAIQAPLYQPQAQSDVRASYQSNYEDETVHSPGYTMSQNYYHTSPSDVTSAGVHAPMYGNVASSSSSSKIFEDLQQYQNTGFIPTTMTAAGQHFATIENGADDNVSALPQIGGMQATGPGPYTLPSGKIDYEINAANYDAATDTANNMANVRDESANLGIIQTNDAYDAATLHDLAQIPAQLQQQQHEAQRQLNQQHTYYSQHQLAFDALSAPEVVQSNVDGIVTFKNYDATGNLPTETKYQQLNSVEQKQHEHQHIHQPVSQPQQKQYLHNFEALQYANYLKNPHISTDLHNQHILDKANQRKHTNTFIQPSFQRQLHFEPEYRINRNQRHLQRSKLRQQRLSRYDDSYHGDNLKSQSRHYYTHAHAHNNDVHSTHNDEHDLHVYHDHHPVENIQSKLPPITHTVHHTPASSAALAGIPLSRHVEVVKHVPAPQHHREFVPYNHSVPIEIPNPVISAISKPYPINIPVSKTIAVPQLQVVRIPIEKIRPMPVERPVPYIVEKRVPYQVEKPVAKPVYVPYPIKVPVLTTVVHRIPAQRRQRMAPQQYKTHYHKW